MTIICSLSIGITIGINFLALFAVEGTGDGSFEVCVRVIDGRLERTVNVTIKTVDGSATSADPKDFSAVSDTLYFNELTTNVCVNVYIIDDNRVEDPEEFTIVVSTLDQDIDLNNRTATVIINDNDEAKIGFETAEYLKKEGENFAVCISVENGLEKTILVNITEEDDSTIG